MPSLRFDAEQRFTCRQCSRCCRRPWDIALAPGEVEAYRRATADRWFREREDAPEGAEADPFVPIPGRAPHMRIRKRADGACGFLSPQNLCRIHEELGGGRKPLTCRLFPYSFHPSEGPPVVTASFCCPTVVANQGATVASQAPDLGKLWKEWSSTYPEPATEILFVPGRPLPGATLDTLRSILREMLDRPGPGGSPDLRANVGRMARTLEDLARRRVLKLPPAPFAEYLGLTGRFAAGDARPLRTRPPSRLARFLFRGFLFSVVAARMQVEDGRSSGLRLDLRLRLRLIRLLAHFHGLWPPLAGIDLGAVRRASLDLTEPTVRGLVHNYLRTSIETLGTGRRPVLEELAVAVALLNAGLALAAMRAARSGAAAVGASHLGEGLMDAVDLTHADPNGPFASVLATLAGGVEALYLFESGRIL